MTDMNTARNRAEDNAQQYVYARDAGHLDYVRKAQNCIRYMDAYDNKQWDDAVKAKLRAEGKPVLSIGKIMPTLAVVMGEQIQNQLDIAFRATSGGMPETAETLDKLLLHVLRSNRYEYIKGDAFDDGIITSRGFIDVRMDFKDNIRGDVRIKRTNGVNTVLDPDASEYDPKTWSQVFTTEWLTYNDIQRLYGKGAAQELQARPQSAFSFGGQDFIDTPMETFGNQAGYQNLLVGPDGAKLRRFLRSVERQYKEFKRMPHFVEPTTGEVRVVPANWDHNKTSMVREQTGLLVVDMEGITYRWTVSCDDVLLHDEVSPYDRFTPIPYFPYLLRGRTIGLVEGLISVQDGLNKARSQELHILSSMANSGWVVKSGSLMNMDISEMEMRGAETGLVIEAREVGDVTKIQPNQIPTGIDRVTGRYDRDFFDLSGIGPGMRSTAREDVSGKALEHQEARGVVNLARPLQNLVRTDELVAQSVLALVQRFYTDERVFTVIGNDVAHTSEEVTINQVQPDGSVTNDLTQGEYEVITTTVPQREQHEDTVFDQLVAMREMGIQIPDEVIVANSRVPNRNEVMKGLEPTEEAVEQQKLELDKLRAEVDELKAKNMETRAGAVQKVAQAKKIAAEDPSSEGGDNAVDMAKHEQEMALEREKMNAEMALEKYKVDSQLEIEREKMQRTARLEERKLKLQERVAKDKAKNDANAKKSRAA